MTDGAHSHATDPAIATEVSRATSAEAALASRITALEKGTPPVVTPPPVTPPPTGTLPATIPASIDATGKTDVSAALSAYFSGLAPGSVAVAPAGAIYAVASAIKIGGRTNVEINGQGATIKCIGTGNNENYSCFYFQTFPGTNSGIKVHDWKLVGNSPTPGTFISGEEGQHGVLVDGGSGFELWNLTISATYGDGVEVNSGATNVNVHDCAMDKIGRNHLSVIWGNGVKFNHNTLGQAGYCTFDVEPNTASEPCFGITIDSNTCGAYTQDFFALDGSSTGAVFHDIAVTNNTSTKTLKTIVTGPGRKTTITFTGNKGTGTGACSFAHVDGLTVTGNTGVTVSVTDCPNAKTSPNP